MKGNKKNNNKNYNRRSIGLKEFDYSNPGWYYVTICTHNRENLLGRIENGVMVLNEWGKIIENEWLNTPNIRSNIELDEYVIMPNHFHGIIIIKERTDPGFSKGVSQYVLIEGRGFVSPSQTLGAVIRGFKGTTTKQINLLRKTPGSKVWQRNFYEHIIRNEKDLYRIRKYIQMNPLKLEMDDLNK